MADQEALLPPAEQCDVCRSGTCPSCGCCWCCVDLGSACTCKGCEAGDCGCDPQVREVASNG